MNVSLKSDSSALALSICRIWDGQNDAVSAGVNTVISRTCACVAL